MNKTTTLNVYQDMMSPATKEQLKTLESFRKYSGHFRCTNAQARELATALDAVLTELAALRATVKS